MRPLRLYNTEELYALFRWIRQYNTAKPAQDRVALYGLDREEYWQDALTRDKFMAENLAEAHARQNELEDAVDAYNQVRERAGLDPHVLGVDVTTQDDVIEAILQERRVELALEGDRWTDLIRTGDAVALLGIDPFQQLFPIPQSELDVAPNLEQNPGY